MTLFADVKNADTCLDPLCFQGKIKIGIHYRNGVGRATVAASICKPSLVDAVFATFSPGNHYAELYNNVMRELLEKIEATAQPSYVGLRIN